MSMITDTQDAALELSAPATAAGESFTVTVTLSDGNSADTTTKTFSVNGGGQHLDRPALLAGGSRHHHDGRQADDGRSLPAYVPSGHATTNYAYDPGTPANGAVAISNFNNSTGGFTVTPAAGFVGVSEVWVGVEDHQQQPNARLRYPIRARAGHSRWPPPA